MDPTREFVEQVLRTGLMLTGLLSDLLDHLPPDAYPGEDNGVILIDMLIGTVRPVTEAAGDETVRAATALLDAIGERTLSDLQAAAELAAKR